MICSWLIASGLESALPNHLYSHLQEMNFKFFKLPSYFSLSAFSSCYSPFCLFCLLLQPNRTDPSISVILPSVGVLRHSTCTEEPLDSPAGPLHILSAKMLYKLFSLQN